MAFGGRWNSFFVVNVCILTILCKKNGRKSRDPTRQICMYFFSKSKTKYYFGRKNPYFSLMNTIMTPFSTRLQKFWKSQNGGFLHFFSQKIYFISENMVIIVVTTILVSCYSQLGQILTKDGKKERSFRTTNA